MKKAFEKPLVFPLLLIVVYLAGIFLGACVIISYPIYFKQKDFFLQQAQSIAQEYLVGETSVLDEMTGPNTHILFFDSDGYFIHHINPTNYSTEVKPGLSLDNYLSSVLSGNRVYRAAFANETGRELPDIMVVTGVPITENGVVIGAAFILKNLMDLPAAIVGYSAYFTAFYWLSAVVIVSNLRKKRKLDDLQRNYIANVTHALKTPVASIKALSETLCDEVEPDPDQQKLYYGMILREANRQDHMIRDILELSKLQSNGMDFSKTKLQAATVFDPLVEKYSTLAECMDITLHISEQITSLPPLFSNAACIKQILEILLDNALKFVPEGGDIWIDVAHTRKQVTFCVRDNGIGITKDALPHVFDRFYKYSHDFNEGGSGLGLAIAKETIAGLNEKIWVESELGHGAAFFFTIRLK